MALTNSFVVLFIAVLLQIFWGNFNSNASCFSLLWLNLGNSQMSVYRTIGPTLVFYVPTKKSSKIWRNIGPTIGASLSVDNKSMGIFPDAQRQLTPQSLVRSGRILNSSEILWLSSLPAKMKKIRSKMKVLECWNIFTHYNTMGSICCHGNQSSYPIGSKPKTVFFPPQWCFSLKFYCDQPTGCGDI